MDHFSYRDGELCCEDVRLGDVAGEHGTPCYAYSAATLLMHLGRLKQAFAPLSPLVCFSVKCCPNIHVLRTLVDAGAGLDVVSAGELYRAHLAGAQPGEIVFAGVGKTDAEIREALRGTEDRPSPVGLLNVESEPEFEVAALAARSMGVKARAALRVNVHVEAGGHGYVQTATPASKFGVTLEHAQVLFEKFAHEKHLRLSGVHVHIGSSIMSPEPYRLALEKVLALMDKLAGKGIVIETLDLGGGFGADYTTGAAHTPGAPSAADFAAVIVPMLRPRTDKGLRVILEPGRSIAANAGVLLTRVLYVKYSGGKKFVVCDAGMNTLLRPALYGAFHFVWPVSVSPMHEPTGRGEKLDLPGLEPCDIVGPLCESGDFLARDRAIPPVARGDLLAVFTAGAYGMSMASRYNSHPLPAEVLIEGARARCIRHRETQADLVEHELSAGKR